MAAPFPVRQCVGPFPKHLASRAIAYWSLHEFLHIFFDLFIDSEITAEPNSHPGTFFKDFPKEPTAVLVAEVITISLLFIFIIYNYNYDDNDHDDHEDDELMNESYNTGVGRLGGQAGGHRPAGQN